VRLNSITKRTGLCKRILEEFSVALQYSDFVASSKHNSRSREFCYSLVYNDFMALVSSSISSLLLQSSSSSSPSFCQVCDLRFSRRSFVSGLAAGTFAWTGSSAAVASSSSSSSVVLAGRVMAANVGDRQAAILATRRGMQLFSKVLLFSFP
jgi:hypothetical protein